MKKMILSLLTMLSAILVNAQQNWDFTTTAAADVAALGADTENWSYVEASNRYESKVAFDGFLTAGGNALETTQGLKFKAAAKKIRIDVNKRVQLAGKNIPVIMLSARGEEYDKLFGFELGIDDYVVKPFSPKELMARVNAVLNRRDASERNISTIQKFEGLEINIAARTISVDGKRVELTPKEYDLLFYMIQHKNIALSREKLLEDIWGYDFFGDDRTIDTHVKNLRNCLGPYRKFIVTLRGVGYKFEYEE
jgi:DNA-binding response OmpR family regulator